MSQKTEACAGPPGHAALKFPFYAPETVRRGEVRPSRMSRKRAAVLIAVHVAAFLHILHWKLAGRTLSPMEPSETFFTLAEGAINAGAILFLASLLATMVLGRWFCGWACHLVALQDLCAWLLKKIGIRPRPLRSRALVFVPLLAGLYMFGYPLVRRWLDAQPPPFHWELTKTGFWDTFPGPFLAIATLLVCGFAIVYLLGAKGFCTYACPYGGLYGVLDLLAPGRIRVTDACKGCGHCTSICTSNVLVHQEVREYGTVMDPGCMKCGDCISVCPEDALYYGFGRPALFTRPRVPVRARPRMFPAGEEFALALAFAGALFVYWGLPSELAPWAGRLYNEMPFLFSLGLASITAFLAITAVRALRRPDFGFQHLKLKAAGRLTRGGAAFLALTGLYFAFFAHCAWVQLETFRGMALLDRTNPLRPAVAVQDRRVLERLDPAMAANVRGAQQHLGRAARLGLFTDLRLASQLAWLDLVRLDPAGAERRLEEAARRHPDHAPYRFGLGQVRAARGDVEQAAAHYLAALDLNPDHRHARAQLVPIARELLQRGRFEAAARVLGRAAALEPGSVSLREAWSVALEQAGDLPGATAAVRQILALAPDHPMARLQLGRLLLQAGDPEAALRELEPLAATGGAEVDALRGVACLRLGRAGQAVPLLERASRSLAEPGLLVDLGEAQLRAGRPADAEATLRRALAAAPKDARAAALLIEARAGQGKR
jgi:tetratricopeptide (TPR) repeat protein/NAD-dependent dihydropyrimidine dehydrogenase PreA subunit